MSMIAMLVAMMMPASRWGHENMLQFFLRVKKLLLVLKIGENAAHDSRGGVGDMIVILL